MKWTNEKIGELKTLLDEGINHNEIGLKLGTTRRAVKKKCVLLHLKLKPKIIYEQISCHFCNKLFEDRIKEKRKFCSRKCGVQYNIEFLLNTDEVKNRISSKLKEFYKKNKKEVVFKKCKSCNNNDVATNKSKYCVDCKRFILNIELYLKLGIDQSLPLFDQNRLAVEKLINEYIINNKTLNQLKNEYNIMTNTIHFFFKKNGLSLRTLSEAQTLVILNGRGVSYTQNFNYKSGWHTTWNNEEVYYRSSYELKYCKFLDENKIKYEVEKLRIKYYDNQRKKTRIAIPDFYLPEHNKIVEIKSEYTLNVENMKDKVMKYRELGYEFELILEGKSIDLKNI